MRTFYLVVEYGSYNSAASHQGLHSLLRFCFYKWTNLNIVFKATWTCKNEILLFFNPAFEKPVLLYVNNKIHTSSQADL